jgi:hypothetical protein
MFKVNNLINLMLQFLLNKIKNKKVKNFIIKDTI